MTHILSEQIPDRRAPSTKPSRREPFAALWRRWRNRALQSPRFHKAAMGTPIGRFFARRSADRLFDLTAGFLYSQILSAGISLGLYDILADEPQALAEIARRLNLNEDAAQRLLAGSASLELLDRLPDGRYTLGLLGAAMHANPGVAAMVRHHDAFYADIADPVPFLRRGGGQGRLARLWNYSDPRADTGLAAGEADDESRRYTELMRASQDLVADTVLAGFDPRSYRRILDIGGGSGRFLERLAAVNPSADLVLFDRAPVTVLAEAALADRPDRRRFTLVSGDFFNDSIPEGADLVTLVRILHDHDDDAVRLLLRRLRAAIAPGGTLLIAEPMADPRHRSRIGDAYFNFYLLAMGSGRPRTALELAAMLREAGFASIRTPRSQMPIGASIVIAR